MIEAQERHEKSPKKVTPTHPRCGSSGGLLICILCRLHLAITVIFYSPPSPSAKTTCIMLEKDFLPKYRKKICLNHIIKQCSREKPGPKLSCLWECRIIRLMVLTIIHATLEVGQEWDHLVVFLLCTQIARKVSNQNQNLNYILIVFQSFQINK